MNAITFRSGTHGLCRSWGEVQLSNKTTSVREADETGGRITLHILAAVSDGPVSQRSLAKELGIALGLTNAYVKRCVRKGLVKVRRAPPNRYAYYVTPKGFAEKSRLTARYLANSFHFYREARRDIDECFALCVKRGFRRLALCGTGEFAEIATLVVMQHPVKLVAVIDEQATGEHFLSLPLVRTPAAVVELDAVVLTDLRRPQRTYQTLSRQFDEERIIVPSLLMVSRQTGPRPEKA